MSSRTPWLAALLCLLIGASLTAQSTPIKRHPSVAADLPGKMRPALRAGERPTSADIEQRVLTRPPSDPGDLRKSRSIGVGNDFRNLLLLLVMGGIIFMVARLVFRYQAETRQARKSARRPREDELRAAREMLAEGDRLLEQGSDVEAMRAFYLHALALLRRLHGIRDGEHLADRLLISRIGIPAVGGRYRILSELFQPVRYGGHVIAAGGAARARDAAAGIRTILSARRNRAETQG